MAGKSEGKKSNIGYLKIRWENNIKNGDKTVIQKGMLWIHLGENTEYLFQ